MFRCLLIRRSNLSYNTWEEISQFLNRKEILSHFPTISSFLYSEQNTKIYHSFYSGLVLKHSNDHLNAFDEALPTISKDLVKIDHKLICHGILLEDVLIAIDKINEVQSFNDVLMSLYETPSLPILKPELYKLYNKQNIPPQSIRRQLLLECQILSSSLEKEELKQRSHIDSSFTTKNIWYNWAHDMERTITTRMKHNKLSKFLNELFFENDDTLTVSQTSLITARILFSNAMAIVNGVRHKREEDEEHWEDIVNTAHEDSLEEISNWKFENGIQHRSISLTILSKQIGHAIYHEHNIQRELKENTDKTNAKTREKILRNRSKFSRHHGHASSEIQLGSELISIALESCSLVTNLDRRQLQRSEFVDEVVIPTGKPPASVGKDLCRDEEDTESVNHQFGRYSGRTPSGASVSTAFVLRQIPHPKGNINSIVFTHPLCHEIKTSFQQSVLTNGKNEGFDIDRYPTIIPPLPWKNFYQGGFYIHTFNPGFVASSNPVVSYKSFEKYDSREIREKMDMLGSVPWRINRDVLDVVEEAFNQNLKIGYLFQNTVEVVDKPDYTGLSEEETAKAKLKYRMAIVERRATTGQLPGLMMKLNIARNLRNVPEFYYPHKVDFRGRAYPFSPHLNHQGNDLSRALLRFAREKALGENGFFWLKIQVANLYGKDKLTFDNRVNWVDDNSSTICDFAENPLCEDYRDFWMAASDEWQFLAAAIEYKNAVKSGNPLEYSSGLPVYQDGSCNGLQHYAALGRDTRGAIAVNLTRSDGPEDKVEDVYLTVLDTVIDNVTKDKKDGNEHARIILANNALKRSVVKQTVMTICYGVTMLGAKEQIHKNIKEYLPSDVIMQTRLYNDICSYLAKTVFNSIGQVFRNSTHIMDWLTSLSERYHSAHSFIGWKTPSGFHVVQPYSEMKKSSVNTGLASTSVRSSSDAKVDSRKQKIGLPPNFIHSLDAAHMIQTSYSLLSRGISFAAVHDSFWTHAADVDVMNYTIRDEFVKMHKRDILADLARGARTTLGEFGHYVPDRPFRGDFDIEKVRESKYFFD